MREYGSVSPYFWIGETGKKLRGDANAQVLALYLMTCPHANMIGIYHCPVMYMAHETGLGFEGASKGLARLMQEGFCTYDEASETVFVCRMVVHQVGESLKEADNRVSGIRKEWEKIAVSSMKKAFFDLYKVAYFLPSESKGLARGSKAPPKQLTGTGQEQDKNKPLQTGFADFWSVYPNRTAKANAEKAWAKLNPDDSLKTKILEAVSVQRQSPSWTAENGRFVPHGATYLNQRRWEDEASEPQGGTFAGAV